MIRSLNDSISVKKPLAGYRIRYFLSYLRSLLFTNLLIYLYTAICGTASVCGSLFDGRGRWQHGCARVWSRLILKTSGIRVRVEGLENLNLNENAILCSNHQSTMDIPILFANLPIQFRFLAKSPLFKVPFLGWHLRRSGHVPVDRDRPHRAMQSFHLAAARIREGSSVLLFAEGRRSRDGQVGPFKAGSFYLAILAGVPVVPITLNGTRAVLQPDTSHVRPGQTEMIIHEPIPTTGLTLGDVNALCEKVRNEILSRFRPPEIES